MTSYRSTKEIAATVRSELKKQLPGWKFSVVVNHHTSITISLISGPGQVVEARHDWEVGRVPYTKDFPFPGYAQLNHYQLLADGGEEKRLTNGVYLTPKGWEVLKKATEILSAEHWDKSDSMTDYFCCAFYRQVQIGKWNQDYQVKAK